MDKTINIVIIIFVLVPCTIQQQDALPLPWEQWAEYRGYIRLVDLTHYLIIDATYKLRHAEKLQEEHKYSITFELGTIAAGIMDHFKRMLRIYREFADEGAFIRRDHFVWQYMYAYHTIQGEYNEIRSEQGMFHKIVRDYEATMGGTTQFTLPNGFKLPPGFSIPSGIALPPGIGIPKLPGRRFGNNPNGTLVFLEKIFKPTLKRRKVKKLPWQTTKKPLWKPAFNF